MAIHFIQEGKVSQAMPGAKEKEWLLRIIKSEKGVAGRINFVFMSDEDLLKVNREFLGRDTYTDVISFPYDDTKKLEGDILISLDRVMENAKRFNCTYENELRRIMVHGLLHIMGYTDGDDEHKQEMTRLEDRYLADYNE